jgi:hypothetical protein
VAGPVAESQRIAISGRDYSDQYRNVFVSVRNFKEEKLQVG